MVPGDLVALKGIVGYGTPELLGGIPPAELNTLHMVQTASIDYYTIKVAGTGATQSVTGGGNNIQATYNEPYECVNLRAGAMTFFSSVMTTFSRGTLAEAVTGYGKSDAYTLTNEIRVELDDSYYYNEPMQVPGHINQMHHNGTFQMNGKKGYELVATLVTGSEDVSPCARHHQNQYDCCSQPY